MCDVVMQARRVYSMAMGYKRGCDFLAESERALEVGSSSTLLGVLALELMLKCALYIDARKAERSHDYKRIYKMLSCDAKKVIMSHALEQCTNGEERDNVKSLHAFDIAKSVFTKGRYSYEECFDLSREDIFKKQEEWEEGGWQRSVADYDFAPNEVDALIYGLRRYIEPKIGIEGSF